MMEAQCCLLAKKAFGGMLLLVLAAVLASLAVMPGNAQVPNSSARPIVGVLSVPSSDVAECSTVAMGTAHSQLGTSCFAAFYVKWLEASGLRVAVLPYDLDRETLTEALHSVNGVLFTGGGLDLTPNTTYFQTARFIYDFVVSENDKGNYMPLWGTCMGFQLLSLLAARNQSVLHTYAFDSEDISLPLIFTPEAQASAFVRDMPKDTYDSFLTNITTNLHHDGVPPEYFYENKNLSSFFRLIATSVDRKGKSFGSTMEAWHYPITGVQWHPERPQFEWRLNMGMAHTMATFSAMQWTGLYFSEQVHKNNNTFTDEQLERSLSIYSHQVVLDPTGGSYQVYFFQQPSS